KCVLTLAAPENVEVVGEAGIPYADEADLAAQLQRVLRDGSLVSSYRLRAQERIRKYYDWEHVVDCYEELFMKMAGLKETGPTDAAVREAVREESIVKKR